jgi:hypothetical protein
MNLENDIKERLEEVLDQHFPKVEEEGPEKIAVRRGAALVLFAQAVIEIKKVIIAFGGCESCYGKGYSTIANEGGGTPRMRFCSCDRGKGLFELWKLN